MPENFFDRWSRRKNEVREELAPPPVVPETQLPADPVPVAEGVAAEGQGEPPPPTLAEAEALTPESDFRPFMARNVAPEVKNTAFRKLFADPQFNVMDGLDTYVDDYSQSMPIPDCVLRQMASAKFLKLFEHEEETEGTEPLGPPPETPHAAAPPDVAQSEPPGDIPSQQVADAQPASHTTDDHHADLRLQPDDAARAEDARRRAG
ncbi:DUF3306 domain-containing protein [Variovorax paradoxus]|uniref:DUF3306 domain-containing protein n=1 Tax=Variovorax paradoxus TaxID=34073 RepID=UPI002783E9FC|nr:DUF3306 domain-containing protein [Variovorax paradoxus]MDP9929736.1 hypothetical protein [Variovorax paradoxus]